MHIDVLHGCSPVVATRINSYMLRLDSYDPRRILNFPSDLDDTGKPFDKLTLREIRGLAGVGNQYYEFWKVRRVFSLKAFGEMVARLPRGTRVRIVRIITNDHDINHYESKLQ